jgi:hypothetical protein
MPTSDWEEEIGKNLCTFQGAAAAFGLPRNLEVFDVVSDPWTKIIDPA